MLTRAWVNGRNVATGLVVTGAALGGALAFWVARRKRRHEVTRSHALGSKNVTHRALGQHDDEDLDKLRVQFGQSPTESSDATPFDNLVVYPARFREEPDRFRNEGEVELTARPHSYMHRSMSGDDFDAIGLEDLGSTFLARATDSMTDMADDELDDLSEIPEFQLSTMSEASSDAAQLPAQDADSQRDSPLEEMLDGAPDDSPIPVLPDELLAEIFDRPDLRSWR